LEGPVGQAFGEGTTIHGSEPKEVESPILGNENSRLALRVQGQGRKYKYRES
jgi:hypothetical protein